MVSEYTVVDAHSHFLPAAVVDLLRRGEYPLARVEDRPGTGTWVVADGGVQFPLNTVGNPLEAAGRLSADAASALLGTNAARAYKL